MLIKEKALNYWIDHFYGYGSWSAPIWFIAYEEGGGDLPEEVANRFDYFYKTHSSTDNRSILCDIRELYRNVSFYAEGPRANLFSNLYEYRFGSNAILHGIWKNLIAFAHGYRKEKLPDLLSYQKDSFVTISAHREALITLYPLPSPHNHAWYYSWLDLPQSSFLKSRALYEQNAYQNRIHHILSNIWEYKPEVVLMYDMNNINELKKSVQQFFPEAKFKMIKGIKQQIPQHHQANFNGTTLLITTQTPALKHNRIETGFDWNQLGKMVKQSLFT